MVLHHSDSTTFPYPFPAVVLGFFLRYPSPLSPHVVTTDVLSRSLDPTTGILSTTRLLLKRGSLPRWAPRGIMNKAESYVVEVSEVDMWNGEGRCVTRNIDHTVVMEVVEGLVMRADGPLNTSIHTSARVTSSWGILPIRSRIEHFGLSRFHKHLPKTRLNILSSTQLTLPTSSQRLAMFDGSPGIEWPGDREKLAKRVKERLEVLRAKARRRRREMGDMVRRTAGLLVEGGRAPDESERVGEVDEIEEAVEEGEEEMTAEEEEELADLERQHGKGTSSISSSAPTTPLTTVSTDGGSWKGRWFWWWRLHTVGLERPTVTKNNNTRSAFDQNNT